MIVTPIYLNFFKAGSDKEVSFDRDAFKQIREQAETTKKEILKQRSEAIKAIDDLRKDWNTKAGRDFFKNLDDTWADDINKFTRTMDAFIAVMDEVESQFQEIENTVWRLHNLKNSI